MIRRHAATCSTNWASSIIWQGQFDAALHQLALARRNLVDHRYANMFIDLEIGQIAMAQGRVADAEAHFERAHGAVRTNDLAMRRHCWPPKSCGESLRWSATGPYRAMYRPGCQDGCWQPRLRSRSMPQRVCDRRPEAPERGRRQCAGGGRRDAGPCPRCRIAGTRSVSVGAAGIPARNRRASRGCRTDWRLRELPEDSRGCLDLTGQSWREMEALSCARLRILTARERFDEGAASQRTCVPKRRREV